MATVEDLDTGSLGTDGEGGDPHTEQTREPRRRRRRVLWAVVGASAIVVAGVAGWLRMTDGNTGQASADTGPVATAVVERGTVAATSNWDGTLDYGTPFTVSSSTAGVVTRLVHEGTTVAPGAELYRVNERPVTLLQGVVPMYRDLAPGASGVDVEQLETNLAQLGYGGFTADDAYNEATADAVRAWQTAIGAAPIGTVGRGDVVFVAEGRRVDTLHVDVGDQVGPGAPVLDITSTEKAVSFAVELDDRELVAVDTPVTVVLPDGDEIPGTVRATTVTQVPADEAGGGPESGAPETESVVQVDVRLDEQVSDDLVGAAVDVVVAIEERTDVLLVPVNALLALAEGGYGLEVVVDDGTTSVVPVTTGLFADGQVEVEGDSIAEGIVVGVAGR